MNESADEIKEGREWTQCVSEEKEKDIRKKKK